MSQADLAGGLNEAIALINAQQFAEARAILLDLSRRYPDQEAIWLWLSVCTDDVDERIGYLRRVLAINPANEKARAALAALTGLPIPATERARPTFTLSPQLIQTLELAALIILAGAAVFVLVLVGGTVLRPILNPPTETPTRTPTFTPSPTLPSPTPRPTSTLPPTWTPAPTNTPLPLPTLAPTLTPRPTFTPIPTRTPSPTFTPLPTNTPPPTETPTPSHTPTVTETPSQTPSRAPSPTETLTPTETPSATPTEATF